MITFTVSKDGKYYTLLPTSDELPILSERMDPKWSLFLKNQDGEGMALSEINLFDVLDAYFKREF